MNNELVEAIQRLEALCASGVDLQERKMQLAVLVEQFRLQGLYNKSQQAEARNESDAADGTAESEQARKYLLPLGLANADTPLPELCRLAALKVMEAQNDGN
ncbi:hypothetical protein FACS18942_05140 [Planctomycetales bacterium]|nr:hypothetical protein FACS18942_05140 [Planctomycetales bacterium]